jgi:threonine/homoserine/homoserine lactone efflux protein
MVLGFLASIPLGPIGIICIQRTLGKGRWSGFISGLGAASADTIIAIIAGLGLSLVINFFDSNSKILVILGGSILVILGARIFFKNPVQQVRERKMNKNSLHTDYLSVLILTLSNPFTIIVFIAIFARLNLVYIAHDFILKIFLFFGILTGASFWWFLLTSFVNIYRAKFRLKNLWWLNKITGAIIIAVGVWFLFSIFFLSRH